MMKTGFECKGCGRVGLTKTAVKTMMGPLCYKCAGSYVKTLELAARSIGVVSPDDMLEPELVQCKGCDMRIPKTLTLETAHGHYGPDCLRVAYDKLASDYVNQGELLADTQRKIERLKWLMGQRSKSN